MNQTTLQRGQGVQILCQQIKVGLSWDILEGENEVDLDASCVLFDEFGVILDAAFYNKKETDDKSVIHSGDCKDGKIEGDDESIIIDFTKISQKVKAIMVVVNAYQGGNFSNVETAETTIIDIQNNVKLVDMSLGRKGKHTGLIMCIVFKDDFNNWHIKNVDRTCEGKNFKDAEFAMKEELYFLIPPEIMAEVKYDPTQQKSFNLKKDQILNIPTGKYTIGLGWDTKCDLDASCGVVSNDGKYHELIYYGMKETKDRAIKHMGDNLTGEGDGDDESIHVNLKKLNSSYNKVIFTVTIYTGGYSFKHVKGAYIRLIDQQNKKEICRYKLTGNYSTNGMIMSSIFRDKNSGQWKFKAIGEEVTGKTIYDLKSMIIQGKMKKSKPKGDFSENIKNLELEVKNAQNQKKLELICFAKNCDKKDFFGLSDPYYIINVNGSKQYQSNPIDNTLNPNWPRVVLNQIDLNTTWDIQIYDHNSILSHKLIGNCSFKGLEVFEKEKPVQFQIINPKKKYNSNKSNSGEFYILVRKYQGPVQKLKEFKQKQQKYLQELDEYNKGAFIEFFK
eukprot:gene12199-5786_t